MAENMVVSLATFIWRESLAAFPRRIEGKHRHGAMAAVTRSPDSAIADDDLDGELERIRHRGDA